MSIFDKIKKYFKTKKGKSKDKPEEVDINERLKNDIKFAKQKLDKFEFVFTRAPKDPTIPKTRKIIDEHNLEYLFIPDVWQILGPAEKIAAMVKFSEKHNTYHLKPEDFEIPTTLFKNDKKMFHIRQTLNGEKLVFDYDDLKMKNASEALTALLAYEDYLRQNMFFKKAAVYQKIADVKSFDELKYYINRREDEFAKYFPDALKKDPQSLMRAIRLYKISIIDRATQRAADVMGNVAYYAQEAQNAADFLDSFSNSLDKNKKDNINKVFGSEENLKMQTIKFVYNVFHNTENEYVSDISLEEALKHFMPMKEQKYNEPLFPYINLPKREEVDSLLDFK